jgi:type IV secretion system protein TrbI
LSRSCAARRRSEGCAAKEPQDLRVSWRGVAGDRGGALQFDRQEDARSRRQRKGQPPQPTLQDNTDNNVQDLKNQLKAEREKEQQQAALAAPDGRSCARVCDARAAGSRRAYGPTGVAAPCIPGQPCPQAGYGPAGYGQPGNASLNSRPEQQQAQLIAAKERERADDARFASNLVYSVAPDSQQQAPGQVGACPVCPGRPSRQEDSSLQSPTSRRRTAGAARWLQASRGGNIDSAKGQPYLVYEGSFSTRY